MSDPSSSEPPPAEHTAVASPVVVLIHGAWHGAWCWAGLQAELDQRGIASYAVDLPGHGTSIVDPGGPEDRDADGLEAHIAHVDAVLGRLDGPVVLVGHSYGGAVVSGVSATADRLRAVVYVAAFAVTSGESVQDIVKAFPSDDRTLGAAIVMGTDGRSTLDPEAAVAALYGSCPEPVVRAALPRLGPHLMSTFATPLRESILGRIPTAYVRCTRDRAVPQPQQDACAARCDETVDLDTDHSPFLSAIGGLADVLERVVTEGVSR